MPLQWNTDFDIGPEDETGSTLNIQPIYPVSLDKGWTLINRAIVPLPKSVPAGDTSSDRETGLGDITMMNWFSPDPKGAFMWGAGPVTVWPTAIDEQLGKAANEYYRTILQLRRKARQRARMDASVAIEVYFSEIIGSGEWRHQPQASLDINIHRELRTPSALSN